MIERDQAGIAPYYKELPNGGEAPCGMRIDLSRVSREEAFEVIISEGTKPGAKIIEFVDSDPQPHELNYEGLGKTPKERKRFFRKSVEQGIECLEKVIILHPPSPDDNAKTEISKPEKYFFLPEEEGITEIFATQKLSKEEIERLLEKLFEDAGHKTITILNRWDNGLPVYSIDPADEELIDLLKRSDVVIVQHDVIQDRSTK